MVVAVVVERCSGVDKPGPKPGCQHPHLMSFTTNGSFIQQGERGKKEGEGGKKEG